MKCGECAWLFLHSKETTYCANKYGRKAIDGSQCIVATDDLACPSFQRAPELKVCPDCMTKEKPYFDFLASMPPLFVARCLNCSRRTNPCISLDFAEKEFYSQC